MVKAKTITEIHSEAEKTLGLRPGATASIRNSRSVLSPQGNISPGGFPVNRPGTGGMMPGMPGSRKMPGMDNENLEVQRSRSMPRGVDSNSTSLGRNSSPLISKTPLNSRLLPQGSGGIVSGKSSALLQGSAPLASQRSFGAGVDPTNQTPWGKPSPPQPTPPLVNKPVPNTSATNLKPEELKRKTAFLIEEYLSVRLLDEALQCIEELKSPSYHNEIVREAINLGLEKNPPFVEPVSKLLEYLFAKNIFTARDISTGCLLYGEAIDDIAIDLPKAPNNFGEILGKLISIRVLNFSVVKEILQKIQDEIFRKPIFDNMVKAVGQEILEEQAADIEACKALL